MALLQRFPGVVAKPPWDQLYLPIKTDYNSKDLRKNPFMIWCQVTIATFPLFSAVIILVRQIFSGLRGSGGAPPLVTLYYHYG